MSNISRSKKKSRTSMMVRKIQITFLGGFAAIAIVVGLLAAALPRSNSNAATGINSSVIYSSPHSYSKPVAQAQTVKLNTAVPDFSAKDIDGQTLRLADWKGNPGILFFADLTCPCVQAYNGRMKALQQEYAGQGVQIAYVFSDPKDTLRGIHDVVQAEEYPWRNVRDADQKLMNLFNVQCTTEVFLIDREGILRYHGRVDDSIFEPEKAKSPDLENAINALLKNEPVKVAETQAYACTIPRIKKQKKTS